MVIINEYLTDKVVDDGFLIGFIVDISFYQIGDKAYQILFCQFVAAFKLKASLLQFQIIQQYEGVEKELKYYNVEAFQKK